MSNKDFPSLDPWQYRVSLKGDGRKIGRMRLQTGPGLNEVLLEDAQGTPVGMLLGFPIDLDGAKRLTGGMHRVGFSIGSDVDMFAERVIDSLGGRFLWLCTADDTTRIYLDCAGQLPCVYDPNTGVAGSSARALLSSEAYEVRFDQGLFDRLGVEWRGWFPAGLTAHEGLLRLLPNHMLDLDNLTVRRHWPPTQVPQCQNPEAAIDQIIRIVRIQMQALIASGVPIAQALTAGRETRMLLGCARPFLKDTTFITVVGQDSHQVDSIIARRITAGEGLIHRELFRREANKVDHALYVQRNGHCVVDTNARFFPSTEPISKSHVFLGGLGGEVGRAFLWRAGDKPSDSLDGADLMARFGLPPEPRVVVALDAWITDLPSLDAHGLLDLAYIEHRMGPWYGAQFPSDPTMERYAPLFTRRTVVLMLGLPPEWKLGERLSAETIRKTWPELLEYPFNSLGPIRDLWIKIVHILREPSAITRKLRKRLG